MVTQIHPLPISRHPCRSSGLSHHMPAWSISWCPYFALSDYLHCCLGRSWPGPFRFASLSGSQCWSHIKITWSTDNTPQGLSSVSITSGVIGRGPLGSCEVRPGQDHLVASPLLWGGGGVPSESHGHSLCIFRCALLPAAPPSYCLYSGPASWWR